MDCTVELTDDPAEEDVRAVHEGLRAYNHEQRGFEHERRFGVFLRDGDGAVVGGAIGRSWGGCAHLEMLWVDAARRGRGHGARLLAAAEREVAARGCGLIHLHTMSFQAPAFYERHGYREAYVIDGFPRGVRLHYLEKPLARPGDAEFEGGF